MRVYRWLAGGLALALAILLLLYRFHRSGNVVQESHAPNKSSSEHDLTVVTGTKNEAETASIPLQEKLPGQPAFNPPDLSDLSTTDRPPLADELGSPQSLPEREPLIVLEVLDAYRRILGFYPAGEDNRQFVNALLGANAQKLPFIPSNHPRLSGKGELVDTWGVPFFFHLNSRTSIEVRSAGPDRIMFNEDDLLANTASAANTER